MLSDDSQVSKGEVPGSASYSAKAPAGAEAPRNILPARRPIPSWLPSTPTSFGSRKANRHPRPCPPFTPSARRCWSCRGVSRESPIPEVRPRRDRRLSIISSSINTGRRTADAASATGMADSRQKSASHAWEPKLPFYGLVWYFIIKCPVTRIVCELNSCGHSNVSNNTNKPGVNEQRWIKNCTNCR